MRLLLPLDSTQILRYKLSLGDLFDYEDNKLFLTVKILENLEFDSVEVGKSVVNKVRLGDFMDCTGIDTGKALYESIFRDSSLSFRGIVYKDTNVKYTNVSKNLLRNRLLISKLDCFNTNIHKDLTNWGNDKKEQGYEVKPSIGRLLYGDRVVEIPKFFSVVALNKWGTSLIANSITEDFGYKYYLVYKDKVIDRVIIDEENTDKVFKMRKLQNLLERMKELV